MGGGVWGSGALPPPCPPPARGGGIFICPPHLFAHPTQHGRRLDLQRHAAGQPVGQFVVRHAKQRLHGGKLQFVECRNVSPDEPAKQDIVLLRPAVGGAIQQPPAPRVQRG